MMFTSSPETAVFTPDPRLRLGPNDQISAVLERAAQFVDELQSDDIVTSVVVTVRFGTPKVTLKYDRREYVPMAARGVSPEPVTDDFPNFDDL